MMSWQENQAFIRRNASLGDEWYLFGIIATCVVCNRWYVHVPEQCRKCTEELEAEYA
jgi:hypothetical protein